jgi:chromosome segregation ATPase
MDYIEPFILLFFVTFLLIFIYYQWLKRLRARILDTFHRNGNELRGIYKKIRSIKADYDFFEPHQQDPYKSYIANLRKLVLALIFQYRTASKLRKNNLYRLPGRSGHRRDDFIHFIRYGHAEWMFVQQREENLQRHLADLTSQVQKAFKNIADLERQSEKTSSRAKKVKDKANTINSIITKMVSNNVWGKTLEDCQNRLSMIVTESEKIPADFRTPYRHKSTKLIITTINVHQILEKIDQPCEILFKDVGDWNNALANCDATLTKARSLFDELEKTGAAMPNSLDVTIEKQRIIALSIELANLQGEFLKPKLERIQAITLQANQIADEGNTLLTALKSFEEQFKKFSNLITELLSRMHALQAGFNSQIGQARYPLRWDLSQAKIDPLITAWEAIEPANILRLPKKVSQDYDKLALIDKDLASLEKVYTTIIEQAKFLRDGWQTIKRITGPEWLQNVNRLVEKVTPYSADNWDTKLQVRTIKEDAYKLIEAVEHVTPRSDQAFVLESKIPGLRSEVQQVSKNIATFEENQKRIEAKYQIIVEKEQAADQKIKDKLPWIRSLIKEINRWDLPTVLIKDIYELGNQGEYLKQELAERMKGSVETKAKNIEAWASKVIDKSNVFASTLAKEIDTLSSMIKSTLEAVDQIGKVKDPEVNSAKQLVVANPYSFEVPSVSIGGTQLYDTIIMLLAARNDYMQRHQTLSAAVETLISIVEQVEKYRREAYSVLARAEQQFDRDWPPIHEEANLDNEIQILQEVEENRRGYQHRTQSIYSLEEGYRDIGATYNKAARQIKEKIRKDSEYKKRYDQLTDMLRTRLRTRINEQLALQPEASLPREQYQVLEQRGLSLVNEIKRNYVNGNIDRYEVERELDHLFLRDNTEINFQTLNISSGGGPIFMGPVDNRKGQINGRSDNNRIN